MLRCQNGPGLGERLHATRGGIRPGGHQWSGQDHAHQTSSGSAASRTRIGARLRTRSGRRSCRRPLAHRLSVRGKRSPRVDARRRAHSLLARVLSRVERCVRGGAAKDVRARRRGENQESLEGAEGARGTARRARASSRTARPRRTLVRPRSHRPEGHSRRRHPHHCRRRPHGALFVALAGRSGAGRRSRHDDQRGQDRAERAADGDQRIAPHRRPRAVARRDFRRAVAKS